MISERREWKQYDDTDKIVFIIAYNADGQIPNLSESYIHDHVPKGSRRGWIEISGQFYKEL